ncbi:MAG: adenylosuccinate synthase [Verrucomicrobia bacterium]|nr:adenylosuccinate synthase [Cytophagales bacterium]
MKVDILLGLQWGDEGKGKIVDFLAPHYQIIARFQGGPNAGHTLEFDGIKHVLHQIPSGVFRKEIKNIIGNGVILDPIVFRREALALEKYNIDLKENLYISKKAQLILPTHKLLDKAYETAKGVNKIGSTQRGIGPTYTDKVSRQGLRIGDMLHPDFEEKYHQLADSHKVILNFHQYDFEAELKQAEADFFACVAFMRNFNLIDSEYDINNALQNGQKILAEGAQGSMLDIDFGSYPFVTSSNTMAAGACTGLGVAPRNIGEVFGIFKAYATRVGGGPFPTELNDETGEKLRKNGNEFGATTGRPRRCGWLDLPALKYAIMINGVSQLIMMKADVLNDFEHIKVCTHYQLADGTITEQLPHDICEEYITPIYKTFAGWQTSLKGIFDFEKLPETLNNYIQYLETELKLPITFLSTGPDRIDTLIKK